MTASPVAIRRFASFGGDGIAPLPRAAIATFFLAGIGFRIAGGAEGGVLALWSFTAVAVLLALTLPLPIALVSPLFAGLLGWVVDMLPFVVLVGWTTAVVRWTWGLLRERRLPRTGRWWLLPAGLMAWTALGVLVITRADFKHFLLLLGIQAVASALVVALVDTARDAREWTRICAGLVAFVCVLSGAVLAQWLGIPVEALQDSTARRTVEEAYGVDAFPNNIGMIKYARSVEAGALELRHSLERVAARDERVPPFEVFRPEFQAYENHLVVRFEGPARHVESVIGRAGVELVFDNIGLAPANTVPRLRSFPRNALTFAGVCAAILPLAFFLAWRGTDRLRLLGVAGIVACLFGAAFSLARGAWVAIGIGVAFLAVSRFANRTQKLQFAGAAAAAAVVLTGLFLVKYGVDPVTGRAGGGASVNTRSELYEETLDSLRGVHIVLGYGTERPRTESGTVKEGTRYVPRAGTHSTYLNYLFRTGLPGALAIMALYGIAVLHGAAASRCGRDRLLGGLLAVSCVVAAAHAVILSLYVEPVYTLAISAVLGLAMAVGRDLPCGVVPPRLLRER